jgi:hypothetical protein
LTASLSMSANRGWRAMRLASANVKVDSSSRGTTWLTIPRRSASPRAPPIRGKEKLFCLTGHRAPRGDRRIPRPKGPCLTAFVNELCIVGSDDQVARPDKHQAAGDTPALNLRNGRFGEITPALRKAEVDFFLALAIWASEPSNRNRTRCPPPCIEDISTERGCSCRSVPPKRLRRPRKDHNLDFVVL